MALRKHRDWRDWERASYRMPFSEFIAISFLFLMGAAIVSGIAYGVYLSYNGYLFRDGIVMHKYLHPAHEELRYDTIQDSFVYDQVPDKWYFVLQKPVRDEICTREIEVTREAFDQFNVGDYYSWEIQELKE